jgi:hypothetical protein
MLISRADHHCNLSAIVTVTAIYFCVSRSWTPLTVYYFIYILGSILVMNSAVGRASSYGLAD